MFYVSISYVDTDGQVNDDPTAGEFITQAEAQAFAESVKTDPNVTHVNISESLTPL